MFLSDSLPSEIRFRQAYTLSFYLLVMGRVSPVPNHTFHTYRFLYTEGFLRAAFQFLHTFHGFHPCTQGSASLCSLFRVLFLTIRQNSLYVTVCIIARPSYRGYFIHSLSTLHYCNAPSLATRLTGDYRDRTYTGKCSPALLDTREKKDNHFSNGCLFILFIKFLALSCTRFRMHRTLCYYSIRNKIICQFHCSRNLGAFWLNSIPLNQAY